MPLLDLHAAADLLSLSPETLRKWAARGRVESVKLGARLLFRREALDALIAQHCRPPREGGSE